MDMGYRYPHLVLVKICGVKVCCPQHLTLFKETLLPFFPRCRSWIITNIQFCSSSTKQPTFKTEILNFISHCLPSTLKCSEIKYLYFFLFQTSSTARRGPKPIFFCRRSPKTASQQEGYVNLKDRTCLQNPSALINDIDGSPSPPDPKLTTHKFINTPATIIGPPLSLTHRTGEISKIYFLLLFLLSVLFIIRK